MQSPQQPTDLDPTTNQRLVTGPVTRCEWEENGWLGCSWCSMDRVNGPRGGGQCSQMRTEYGLGDVDKDIQAMGKELDLVPHLFCLLLLFVLVLHPSNF